MATDRACGVPNKCDTENTHISLLEVNGNYLYIGLENATYGLNIWRVNMASFPSGQVPAKSAFALVSSFGLGNAAVNKRVFSTTRYVVGTDEYLFVSTGNGSGNTNIFRTID